MKYSLLLIAVFLFVMWFGFYLIGIRKENKKKSYHRFYLHCPDTCVVRLINGIDLRGVDVPYWKQTIECDCREGGGRSYNSVTMPDSEITDSIHLINEATSLNIKATSYFNKATNALRAGDIKTADRLAALGYSTKRKADSFYHRWKKQNKKQKQ